MTDVNKVSYETLPVQVLPVLSRVSCCSSSFLPKAHQHARLGRRRVLFDRLPCQLAVFAINSPVERKRPILSSLLGSLQLFRTAQVTKSFHR